MTDESFDMTTIEGCIGWGLFRNPPERGRLEAEVARLRAVEAAARVVVADDATTCLCHECHGGRMLALIDALAGA